MKVKQLIEELSKCQPEAEIVSSEFIEEHDEYEIEFDSTEKRVEKRVIKTYGKKKKKIMLDWIESERDELLSLNNSYNILLQK